MGRTTRFETFEGDWRDLNLKGQPRGSKPREGSWRIAELQDDGSVLIPLSNGMSAVIDEADAPKLFHYNWSTDKDTRTFYAVRRATNRNAKIIMHREIMQPGQGMVVDHINGNGLDNRRCNLRVCTQAENIRNQSSRRLNKLGLKGVHFHLGKFRACIRAGGHSMSLGSFICPLLAYIAYCRAARKHHGEFASL